MSIKLFNYSSFVQIVFEAQREGFASGDIAIDDILMKNGACVDAGK